MRRTVIERLFEEPHRYGFFQAVRLLQRWFSQQERLHGAAVFESRIQFHNSLSLSFPASEIAVFDVARPASAGGGRPASPRASEVATIHMTPAFMGLLGVGGALPLFYTELMARREIYDKDPSARAFLDVFLHRAVVLFYQAWRKHRLALGFEEDRSRAFTPMLLSLAGLGQTGLQGRMQARDGGVADDSVAQFAGLLQQRPLSAEALRQVLQRYFNVNVKVEQFVGRWFTLPTSNQTSLGLAGSAALGAGAVVGQRVWQRDLSMRLVIGPLNADRFQRFLPGGSAARALEQLVTLATGVQVEYDVRLELAANEVLPIRLNPERSARLGWDSFLQTQPCAANRRDAGYQIHAVA
jgi:type VI secretion system protein ImpH